MSRNEYVMNGIDGKRRALASFYRPDKPGAGATGFWKLLLRNGLLAETEDRGVRPPWQIDDDRLGRFLGKEIVLESFAKLRNLNTNDRVGVRIVPTNPAKYLDSDPFFRERNSRPAMPFSQIYSNSCRSRGERLNSGLALMRSNRARSDVRSVAGSVNLGALFQRHVAPLAETNSLARNLIPSFEVQ